MNPSGLLGLFFQLSFFTNHFINLRLSSTRNSYWCLLDERNSKNIKHFASKKLTMMNTKEENFEKSLKYLTLKIKILKFLISKIFNSILIFFIFLVLN